MSVNRVEKLSLSAKSRDSVARCLPTIEDAFQTASFRGIPASALILVKYFNLGKISRLSSSVSLSNKISDLFDDVTKVIVNIDREEAASAGVVYFSDPIIAWARWLLANIDSGVRKEWYWAPLQGMLGYTYKSFELKLALVEIYRVEGYASHDCLLNQIEKLGALDLFLASLTPMDVPQWPKAQVNGKPKTADQTSRQRLRFVKGIFKQYIRRWGKDDPRSLWLVRSLCSADISYQHNADSLEIAIQTQLTAIEDEKGLFAIAKSKPQRQFKKIGDDIPTTYTDVDHENPVLHHDKPALNLSVSPNSEFVKKEENIESKKILEKSTASSQQVDEKNTAISSLTTEKYEKNGVHLDFSGLFFLIRIIGSLDNIKVSLKSDERINIPWLVFYRIVRLIDPDCALRLLTTLQIEYSDEEFQALFNLQVQSVDQGKKWGELAQAGQRKRWEKLKHDLEVGNLSVSKLTDFYIGVISKYLWCRLGHGIKGFCQLKAKVEATSTHLDFYFDSVLIDMKYRRLGLDSDPGWVPWMQKIVRFHYSGEKLKVWQV